MPSVARKVEINMSNKPNKDSGSPQTATMDPSSQWKYSSEDGTLLRDSDSKCHSVYDSGCLDSGFLSGGNLSMDQYLSSEENIKSRNFSDSEADLSSKTIVDDDSKIYVRLDSGVDLGLNEQFSGLSLKSSNDLNEPSPKNQDVKLQLNVPTSQSTTVRPVIKEVESIPPWQLYFQPDEDGDTQLHLAVMEGFIEAVFALIRMSPHPCFLDLKNDNCQTALHLAVLTKQSPVVRGLLLAGADAKIRDRKGNTALHLASELGYSDCVLALLSPLSEHEKKNSSWPVSPVALEERNWEGFMCVHLAAMGQHIEALRLLVKFGANINATDATAGRSILHLAVEQRLGNVFKFLLEETCRGGPGGLKLDATTYGGITAYQLASCVDIAIAEALAARGAKKLAFPDEDSMDEDEEEIYGGNQGNYFQEMNKDAIKGSA